MSILAWELMTWEHLAPGWMDLASLSQASYVLVQEEPWPRSPIGRCSHPSPAARKLSGPRIVPALSMSSSLTEMTIAPVLPVTHSCCVEQMKKMHKKKVKCLDSCTPHMAVWLWWSSSVPPAPPPPNLFSYRLRKKSR